MANEQIIPRSRSRENRLRLGRAQNELGTDLTRFASLQELRSRDAKSNVRLVTVASLAAYTAAADAVDGARTLTADANGALSVDSVAVAVGDRILLKNGAAGADNGIYEVVAAGGASAVSVLKRAVDADSSAEVTGGLTVFVTEGSTKGDTWWTLTTNGAIVLDTTSLTFSETSGAGFATYAALALTTAGNGASLIGIEDALSKITAATVEGALAEIAPLRIGPTAVAAAASRVTGDTEQVFGNSLILPANSAAVGKTSRGKIVLGYAGVNGADTTTVALKVGGSDVASAVGLDPAAAGDFIVIDIEIKTFVAGASGVASMKFTISLFTGSNGVVIGTPKVVNFPLQTYNTTAALTLTVGNTFSSANGANLMDWRMAEATVGF